MEIIIVENEREGSVLCTNMIRKQLIEKKNSVLGLATGRTMIPLYKEIANMFNKKRLSFSEVKTFNLDEYLGLSKENKNSFYSFMQKNIFRKVNIKKENINFLNGNEKDWSRECSAYEKKIKSSGGIDLQILGIGTNGHIGFNEPGSKFSSITRKVKLAESTKRDNKIFFKKMKVPEYALTMGIKTILSAKRIILLAFGEKKSDIIKKFIKTDATSRLPATFLKNHKKVTIILDKKSAG